MVWVTSRGGNRESSTFTVSGAGSGGRASAGVRAAYRALEATSRCEQPRCGRRLYSSGGLRRCSFGQPLLNAGYRLLDMPFVSHLVDYAGIVADIGVVGIAAMDDGIGTVLHLKLADARLIESQDDRRYVRDWWIPAEIPAPVIRLSWRT